MKKLVLVLLLALPFTTQAEIDPFKVRHDLYVHAVGGAVVYTVSRGVFQNVGLNDTDHSVCELAVLIILSVTY